ncbi:signal recognition particle-docking protein FtsY [Arthrobacter sp. MYb211]|uniref:signal recognition particle-docking protein FtsY n=1 Tax=unclassified Arthrobacter TaxID=235627 RepID=UPI000CFD968A|nr:MULTISPECIES: signal recognition particle-docking protein FtsY [unclassified Arthrobacter]PRA06940.1 signal recognition particle-docking protein FtsY [Arthrobacter sp. MYb229]PRA14062.1 signal recognition particle-docking protein FtsY [Arthrobacter sp. MYb221]PRB47888.1 signal recognition particle-docking protein FtsY [Arthrobacter sp. MYb216]PRC06583.1 signal recognition particle-docking protein FtsY [Arthrobacter sp. MYb211]
MTDQLLFTIIIVAVIAVVAIGVIAFVAKGRKPKTPYTSERDADDTPTSASPAEPGDTPAEGQSPAGAVLTEEPPVAPAAPAAPALDVPEPVQGRLARLRARLTKSNNMFSKGLLALLSQDSIDEDVWEEIEETLLLADLGTEPALELVDALRERVKVEGSRDPQRVKAMLREELLKLVDPTLDRSYLPAPHPDRPSIIMVVGVNGVGKTTTIGKLARVLVAEDKDVLLGAADTFRAAAAEQLATWGDRVGVPTVRSQIDGADPASVAFEAVSAGIDQEVDIVMIDTAGRLQNKVGLMDELGKIKRVVEKKATIDEVLLVLDATTGQNGLAQAKVFSEVVNVNGIVLTKLDGTAKGGIVVAIQRQLGVPVKLVGLGEGPDDLAPFDPEAFVDALLED